VTGAISLRWIVQRLFSNFAGGWPGAGVLLLRVLAGGGLVYSGFREVRSARDFAEATIPTLSAAGGVLLVAGLYTPLAGIAAAALELWIAFSRTGSGWEHVRMAGLALCLAMIGPGAWSVDARLFGRRQINLLSLEKVPDVSQE
jgi:putative oxidoreductase